jgi:hypothetical protein
MSSKFEHPLVQAKQRDMPDKPSLKTPSQPPEKPDSRTAAPTRVAPARTTPARTNGPTNGVGETMARRKPGRPAGVLLSNGVTLDAGKRRHPDYVQITAYITRKTHHATRLALLEEEMCAPDAGLAEASAGQVAGPVQGRLQRRAHKRHELSELIEELLTGWLAGQGRA